MVYHLPCPFVTPGVEWEIVPWVHQERSIWWPIAMSGCSVTVLCPTLVSNSSTDWWCYLSCGVSQLYWLMVSLSSTDWWCLSALLTDGVSQLSTDWWCYLPCGVSQPLLWLSSCSSVSSVPSPPPVEYAQPPLSSHTGNKINKTWGYFTDFTNGLWFIFRKFNLHDIIRLNISSLRSRFDVVRVLSVSVSQRGMPVVANASIRDMC